MTQEKAIPAVDSWGTRKARDGEPAVTFQVTAVDPVKEQLTLKRFVGYANGAPLLGRLSTLDFKTWRTNRYQPCDAPVPPMADAIDRQEAETRLLALGLSGEAVFKLLWPDVEFDTAAWEDPSGEIRAIMAAHKRYLDKQDAQPQAPAVAVFVPPEPADVKAEIAALRGDVAGIREDFKALVDALRSAAPQLGLKFGAAA